MSIHRGTITTGSIARGFIVLSVFLCLVKGTGYAYDSSYCSDDRITTAVELVLDIAPEYGFHFQPPATIADPASPGSYHNFQYIPAAAQHGRNARAVLKSSAAVFAGQSHYIFFRSSRGLLRFSSDIDPQPRA